MHYYKDFDILSVNSVSAEFLKRDITTFSDAALYVKALPYGRNNDKTDILSVLKDNRGTCSTKHALLKLLAEENGHPEFRLMMGIYKMNGCNTHNVSPILSKYNIDYLPEAHNYLKYDDLVLDCTRAYASPADFIPYLLEEMEIYPEQVTEFKAAYHKEYLKNWMVNEHITSYTLNDIWNIREECIQALSTPQLA